MVYPIKKPPVKEAFLLSITEIQDFVDDHMAAASANVQLLFLAISKILSSSPEKKAPASINGTTRKVCMASCI